MSGSPAIQAGRPVDGSGSSVFFRSAVIQSERLNDERWSLLKIMDATSAVHKPREKDDSCRAS